MSHFEDAIVREPRPKRPKRLIRYLIPPRAPALKSSSRNFLSLGEKEGDRRSGASGALGAADRIIPRNTLANNQ